MIRPASTKPRLAPVPTTPEIIAIPATMRGGGNSSRMIPMASGTSAPPAPWSTLPASSSWIEVLRAHTSVPAKNDPSTQTISSRLPKMSPKRLRIGAATAATSRYPLSSQETAVVVVWTSCWMVSSAGVTIDCISV